MFRFRDKVTFATKTSVFAWCVLRCFSASVTIVPIRISRKRQVERYGSPLRRTTTFNYLQHHHPPPRRAHAPRTSVFCLKVCGRCRGRLALFGTHNADGKLKKPRAATGFSLFVKERYAEVKKTLPPGTKQQEVMKVRFDTMRYGLVRCGTVQCGTARLAVRSRVAPLVLYCYSTACLPTKHAEKTPCYAGSVFLPCPTHGCVLPWTGREGKACFQAKRYQAVLEAAVFLRCSCRRRIKQPLHDEFCDNRSAFGTLVIFFVLVYFRPSNYCMYLESRWC